LQGGGDGGFVVRVFGAVFVAGQVVAILVAEGFLHLDQTQGRGQCGFEGVATVEQFTTVDAVQPDPQRVLGRRVLDANAGQRRETAQAVDLHVEGLGQGFAETDHRRPAVHLIQQIVDRLRQRFHRLNGEKQVTCLRRNWGGENARLVVTHVNSLESAREFTCGRRICGGLDGVKSPSP
jgi:hypothetical protein